MKNQAADGIRAVVDTQGELELGKGVRAGRVPSLGLE